MLMGQLFAFGLVWLFISGALFYVKRSPERKTPDANERPLELPNAIEFFRHWEWFSRLLLGLFTLSFTLVWEGLFQFAAQQVIASFPAPRFIIAPDAWFWLLPAVFFGIVTAAIGVDIWLRCCLKQDYSAFTEALNQKAGFSNETARRFCYTAFSITGVLVGVFLFFGLNWYTVFTNDRMIINQYFSLRATQYRYADIKSLRLATHVKGLDDRLTKQLSIILTFKDGKRWQSMGYGQDANNAETEQLLEFLVSRTAAQVDRRTCLEEITYAGLKPAERIKIRERQDWYRWVVLLAVCWFGGRGILNKLIVRKTQGGLQG